MFGLALLHVATKPGRAWAAIRESEPAALAAGVNITLYKLWAFGLAAFMTGVAGCLLVGLRRQPRIESFPTQASITLLADRPHRAASSASGARSSPGLFIQCCRSSSRPTGA